MAPSLLVPNGSVASTTGRTFVIRVRGGRTEWIDVKTGLASGPLVEVFGDLKPGDEIAARGTDELKAGASVHVKHAKARVARFRMTRSARLLVVLTLLLMIRPASAQTLASEALVTALRQGARSPNLARAVCRNPKCGAFLRVH
jgi:hypothetical protein